jgi:hypothetical protein
MLVGLTICFVLITAPSYAQSMNPQIRLEFSIAAEQLEHLRTILMQFASSAGFSVDNYGKLMPARNGRPLFWLRLFEAKT